MSILPELELTVWIAGGLTALLVGVSKTGIPGAGILAVPVMATLFEARASVGLLLPMLITADVFAVWYHHKGAQWDKVAALLPWVAVGGAGAAAVLVGLGQASASADMSEAPGTQAAAQYDVFKMLVGIIVSAMLVLRALRAWLGERLTPSTKSAVAGTGALTGFATTLANAAGPVMTLYLAGMKMPKSKFMGTNAWFFLILNVCKIPIYLVVDFVASGPSMITANSLSYNAVMAPVVIEGCGLGIVAFKAVSQRVFDICVIALAAAAALHLIIQV